MAKIKNISGDDRIVTDLGSRLALAGQIVDVPLEDVYSYTCQATNWSPADPEAQAAHDAAVAALDTTEAADEAPVTTEENA